ncbi:MAG: DNA-directed RNA polymerase subunit G [Acidilobus sp.]
MITLELEVKAVEPSKLEGVRIARAEGNGEKVIFDMIEDLYVLSEGQRFKLVVSEEKPADLDSYEFCGHGYLVTGEDKGYTLISLWGVLFKFEPPLGLKTNQKYYLCIKRG